MFRFAGTAIRMHFRPRHSHPFEHISVVIAVGGGYGTIDVDFKALEQKIVKPQIALNCFNFDQTFPIAT